MSVCVCVFEVYGDGVWVMWVDGTEEGCVCVPVQSSKERDLMY